MAHRVEEKHIITETGLLKEANNLGVFGFGKLLRSLLSLLDKRYVKKQFGEEGEEIDVFDRVETHVQMHIDDKISTTLKHVSKEVVDLRKVLEPYAVRKTIQGSSAPRRVKVEVPEINIHGRWVRKGSMADYNYSTNDISTLLDTSVHNIRVLCSTGALVARKNSNRWEVTKHSLFDYIVKNMPNITRFVTEDRIVAPKKQPADVVVEYLLEDEEAEKENE